MTPPPVVLEDVVAKYDYRSVLERASLQLQPGTITGLLGRNGSGKTTLMRVALGFMKLKSGQAMLFETPAWDAPPEVRRRIGYVPQSFYPFAHMRVEFCLKLVGSFYDSWDADLVDSLRHEWRLGDRRIGELSPGDRQKVSILLAIGHRPDLLVLDEPAASLDPGAKREFLRALVDLNAKRDQTVLLSSNITSDIERICSHVAILHGGRIVCHAALDEIKDRVRRVVLGESPRPPAGNVLASAGDCYWLWDWRECGLPKQAVPEEVVLDDLFLAITRQ